MAKRFQPFCEFSRGKKAKLDITISRERPILSAAGNTNRLPSTTTTRNTATTAAASDVCDFWDDDDDDVILLATQVAESQVFATTTAVVTESDITFTDFAPNLRGTSTQHFNVFPTHAPPALPTSTKENQKSKKSTNNDPLAALFDDDDECFESLVLPNDKKEPEAAPAAVADLFKKPVNIGRSAKCDDDNKTSSSSAAAFAAAPLIASHSMPSTSAQSQSMARRQLASERQIKFLMDRVDKLKKDNSNMEKELGDYKDQMESKTGETSLLRDEVRYLKQQIQTLKMDKIMIAESAKTECRSKIDEINKVVNAKQTELQLKDVEYSILKMKHADETRRFEMSMFNESAMVPEDCNIGNAVNQATKRHRQAKNPKRTRKAYRLNDFILSDENSELKSVPFDPLIYEDIRAYAGRKHRTLLEIELDKLQKIYLQFQHKPLTIPEPGAYEKVKSRLLVSICKVFPEFWSYVHSLEFPEEALEYKYERHDLEEYKCPENTRKLIQPTELYRDELAITLRRYIAILALLCRQEVDIARSIIQYKHGEYLLLQIASDAIAKLGYSKETHDHFGLLEAFATLLNALLTKYDKEFTLDLREMFLDHLKQLVFTRPNAWVFQEISSCFLSATRHKDLLDLCCVNSPSDCFHADRVRSSFLFSEDSCLMQVYAGLLEIPFGFDKPLSEENFLLLANICDNHIRFVTKCLKEPPKFVRNMLSCFDEESFNDEPKDTQNTANTSNTVVPSMLNLNSFASNNGSSTNSSNSTNVSTTNHCGSLPKTDSSRGTTKLEELEPNCECYVKMCLSLVTLFYQLLRHWLLSDKQFGKLRVSEISRIGIHVLEKIFREYYIIALFQNSEETTKHYISLIHTWCSEYAADLKFSEFEMLKLGLLKEAHFMLEPLHQVGNLENISNDLKEWKRLAKSTIESNDDINTNLQQLTVQDCLDPLSDSHITEYFEIAKGYAFNFE